MELCWLILAKECVCVCVCVYAHVSGDDPQDSVEDWRPWPLLQQQSFMLLF